MKLLIFGLFFIGFAVKSIAQFDDLKILYADGSYAKLIKEATKYCEKDDTKKDPLPHLWLAKGYYMLSKTSNDAEDKNAFKDALGAVSKFLKNDKDGAAMSDADNNEFVELIQSSLMEQIDNEITTGNYRKAYSWVIKYKKISNNAIGAIYLEGATKFKTDDKSTAFGLWRQAEEALETVTTTEDWSETDLQILKIGVMQSAECLVSVRQVDKARALLDKVAPKFEGDEDFKTRYDSIVN